MRRFVIGPELVRAAYDPPETFAERLRPALEAFREDRGVWPDACYVSVRFPGDLPGPMLLDADGDEMVALNFRRQTLLGPDEILLGVEIETDLREGDDERFNERTVG